VELYKPEEFQMKKLIFFSSKSVKLHTKVRFLVKKEELAEGETKVIFGGVSSEKRIEL
jgi:hypothetical protein